jgi:hypothetical protein
LTDAAITTRSELRKFGLLFGIVFALLAAYFYLRFSFAVNGKVLSLLLLSGLFFLVGLLNPYWLFFPHKWWMTFARVLGVVNTKIILSIFFYLILTPLYFVVRMLREDPLYIRKPAKDSYWLLREKKEFTEKDYDRPF